jgi:hypothetical protein
VGLGDIRQKLIQERPDVQTAPGSASAQEGRKTRWSMALRGPGESYSDAILRLVKMPSACARWLCWASSP